MTYKTLTHLMKSRWLLVTFVFLGIALLLGIANSLCGKKLSEAEVGRILTGQSEVPDIDSILVIGRRWRHEFTSQTQLTALHDVLKSGLIHEDIPVRGPVYLLTMRFSNGAWFDGWLYIAEDETGFVMHAMTDANAWDPDLFNYLVSGQNENAVRELLVEIKNLEKLANPTQ